MKKTILLIFAVFAASVYGQERVDLNQMRLADLGASTRHSVNAVATSGAEGLSSIQRAVGYIVNNAPDSITMKGALIGSAGTFPVAVAISDDILDNYAGCKVVGIRVAAAQSLGKSEMFLYSVNNGVVSEEGITKSQRLYEGWNNVFFNGDTSWEIQEGQTLIVGFEYTETEAMVEAGIGGLCTVGEAKGNDFLVYGNFGSGEGWYGVRNLGSLCIQLIVDVSSLPAKELSLGYLDTGFRYKKAGESIDMYVIAMNTGREDIASYTLTCQVDEEEPQVFTYDETLPEHGNAHLQPSISLPADIAVGEHRLTVSLQAGESADEKGTDSSIFYIYDKSLPRMKNYVEQYNSQNEYMASIVNPIFNQVASNNDAMVLVNVYEPGNPLSLPASDYLHTLYAYTLPSFTSNRSYFPGESYIAYDVNYYAEQYAPLVPSIIEDIIAQDLAQPAFATVELQGSINEETRELTIDVTGELAEGALDILGTPALTLLLAEDNVKGEQTVLSKITQRPTVQKDYMHQHVLRAYVTPALGAPVSVNGLQYSAHYTFNIDPSWDINNLTLVGFITRSAEEVTDENVMQMDVTNCNSISLADLTGIGGVTATPSSIPEYFSIDGRRLQAPPSHGIYIIRQGGVSRKNVVK